ncbi:MAG: GNAT family N-acetyltransferase [Gammaproteobacteria bacterium]|nr:GNAT family N-acetyltransferase [Gammaproteobacteria bacterium]MDD9894862.1 GNAT family N-acetyltransferase [Gammaproteobacteria bacterium]MDD9957938.1 GNAT family N-acetyltransferase [Gammaproteobacteria bacterium]
MDYAYLADRPEDVPKVIAWWRTEWGSRMGSDIESLESQLRQSLSKTELPIHILAIIDGNAVGTSALKFQEAAELFPDYHYWLGSVFVDARFRGKQIASKLILQILELAKQKGLPHLYLQTLDLSGGLYTKLGWQAVQEFNYKDEQTLLMLKKLS